MKPNRINMREARARLAELLDDAERGNVTVIARRGRAVAAIIPMALLDRLAGSAAAPAVGHAVEAAVAEIRAALGALERIVGEAQPPAVQRAQYEARPGRVALVAKSLAELRGPKDGVVELPLRLFWSAPDRTFDLGRTSMLQSLYETVLREASRPEDLTSYLNGERLAAVWAELYLPKGVRRAWEDQHPALRTARLATA